jgi:hypothetical protein
MKWETLMVVCFLFGGSAEKYQGVDCKVLIFRPCAKYLWMLATFKKEQFWNKKATNIQTNKI